MNAEKQRIAIAEACGWSGIHEEVRPAMTYLWGYDDEFEHPKPRSIVPDYLNDLNAMHEAEKMLLNAAHAGDWRGWETYRINLAEMVGIEDIFHTTAAQRAEAFLRTIGKWEE